MENELNYDFLSSEIRQKYGLNDSDNVSGHGYDSYALEIINSNQEDSFWTVEVESEQNISQML